jgi:hypothetical protein
MCFTSPPLSHVFGLGFSFLFELALVFWGEFNVLCSIQVLLLMAAPPSRTDEFYRAMDLCELNKASKKHLVTNDASLGRW